MKKLVLTAALASSLSAFGAEMVGYISDAQCGARNANSSAESQECAKSCVKSGSAAVFVTEKDQKVYKVAGPVQSPEHGRPEGRGRRLGEGRHLTSPHQAG